MAAKKTKSAKSIKALSGATITTSGNIVAGYGNYYDMTGNAEVTAV